MAQTSVLSPLPLHLHDSSLNSALKRSVSREPSPWASFLTPSLFADPGQRSSPLPAVAAAPSPLKHSTTGLFTHQREINPFEQSFAHPILSTVDDGLEIAQPVGGLGSSADGAPRTRRKRALSSPALWTPGGTGEQLGDMTAQAFLHQAKRPSLRLAVQTGQLASTSFVPSESTMSMASSGNNSFDETIGSSLLRHRRGTSLGNTLSPDSSIAPSPHSPKHASPFPPAVSTFSHFQPQPIPLSIPAGLPATAPYADPSVFASATLAPPVMGVDAIAPLPYMAPPPPPVTAFDPHAVAAPMPHPFAFPADPYAMAPPPFAPSVTIPSTMMPVAVPDPSGLAMAASPVVSLASQFPNIPTTSLAPSTSAYMPPQALSPVVPVPPAVATAVPPPPTKKAAPAKAKHAPVQLGPDGQPLPKPKLPGKKRGRKPKNWDPTLEQTIELEPEEQEKQRKIALERNRIAASKSRRRKKERVEMLETASTDLCNRNIVLQADCRALLAEVHHLRALLGQSHPPGCTCVHIQGYLAREADGGGIPAILYGAGQTVNRDYTNMPRYGADDDLFAGVVEGTALEALVAGAPLGEVPGLAGITGPAPKGKKAQDKAHQAATAAAKAVVGSTNAKSASPSQGEDGEHDDSSDEEDEELDEALSEEEKIMIRSTRARGIAARSKAD
ncbi:hypothetical protein JCM10207_004112 [Rhodosporidiobolus poonsookiae]